MQQTSNFNEWLQVCNKLLHKHKRLLQWVCADHTYHRVEQGGDQRPKEANVTNRDRFSESTTELSTPLSVLYSVVEDAQRYEGYLKENAQGIYDQELADFLGELRDETNRRAKRAEVLLAQRLADGGVR